VIGYAPIDIAKITFTSSREPLIASRSHPNGLALAPYKFVFHQHSAISGDPTRGGLIRPLGWMFLFTQLGVKNLARFVEKFGLPFVIGRLDDGAWDQDRHKVAALIRNFGSDGGGVFSKAVELEFKEASASGGDLFFKMLEYFGDAKTRVVLGQLATSGDSGGFSKGGAQALVRQDLLESDCTALAATFKRDVIAPWTMLNYGADAPTPDLVFDFAAPEDMVAKSQIIANLFNAGLEVDDPEQASKLVGINMRRKVSPPALPDPTMLSGERRPSKPYKLFMAEAARSANEQVAKAALRNLSQDEAFLSEFIGPVADAIGEALAGLPDADPTPEQAAEFSRRLSALIDARPRIARKMDSRALEDQLFQAMIAADANGRLAVLAGLTQGARGA
jgi:phage gp29-like protein